MFDPEAIEVALFNLIGAAVQPLQFMTIRRNNDLPQNTDPSMRPALYLVPIRITARQDETFGATRFQQEFLIQVLGWSAFTPHDVPQTFLNNVFKVINEKLSLPFSGEKQTLGGLVANAWINGDTLFATGVVPGQEVELIIPVSTVTGN